MSLRIGALDNFRGFCTIRKVYLCSDCMLNLTCNFNIIKKICEFFLQRPFLKVYFLKMAATVMTVVFCTIHLYPSLEENSEACF